MKQTKNFEKNLQEDYKNTLLSSIFFLILYNLFSILSKVIYRYVMLNQAELFKDSPLLLSSIAVEIILILGLVTVNLALYQTARKVVAISIYILGFVMLCFVFHLAVIDLAVFYLTIVWVESTIFADYDSEAII